MDNQMANATVLMARINVLVTLASLEHFAKHVNVRMGECAKHLDLLLPALVNLASRVTNARQSIAVTVHAKTEPLAHLGVCTCPSGFTGTLCDKIDCGVNPCLNQATCESEACTCTTGLVGTLCNVIDCQQDGSPCQNSGDCLDIDGVGQCDCPTGFTGPFCETSFRI